MKREIPLHVVVKQMREGIEKAFDCNIDFYDDGVMIFTFNYCYDDYLSLRVENDTFTVESKPDIYPSNIDAIAYALKNAAQCMESLHVKPV